ncbi:histidine--tRNA ligase [Candidatus Berkelbacteria bacterium]|nr:histidine--tRNA ligase [Candidatus Berkelbacteria bacterium]
MPQSIQIARGMRDVLPTEQKYWTKIQTIATNRLRSFGFQRIDTPIIEAKDLFVRGVGTSSDLIEKELFGVVRLGTHQTEQNTPNQTPELVLRPEGTAGIVRAYIENGMHTWPQPVKLFSFMPIFRYDRPQKGRYRQHTQLNVEVLGDGEPLTDAMTILALWQILQDLELDQGAVIELNSIGDSASREQIRTVLHEYYQPLLPKLCANCQRRFKVNPLRLVDCKEEQCQPYRETAPQIVDSLDDASRQHFMLVLEYLDSAGVPYELNPFLVRGLDYYTRTVFEIRDRNDTHRQASLGGGGRYDTLVESLGGLATPAFGFGIGLERLIEKLVEKKIPIIEKAGAEILIIQLGDRAKKKAIPLLVSLGKKGLAASMALGKESLKAQLKSADKMGARLALIVGEREAIDDTIIVRMMSDGTQETVHFDDVESVIEKRLAELNES